MTANSSEIKVIVKKDETGGTDGLIVESFSGVNLTPPCPSP